MPLAAIGIGSNLGDRRAHIGFALAQLAALPRSRLVAAADPIETTPLAAPGIDPGGPYLNSAALLETQLAPRELLHSLLQIEAERGRTRSPNQRWAPRTLDLDLLLLGDAVINEPGLTVPHPQLHRRTFVLAPLAQIAPDLVVPTLNRTIRDLHASLTPPHT